MSLFPAYLDEVPKSSVSDSKDENEEKDWLENQSFPDRLLSSSSTQVEKKKKKKERDRSATPSSPSTSGERKTRRRSKSRDRPRSKRSRSREKKRRSRTRSRSREKSGRKRSREKSRHERSRSRSRSRKKSKKNRDREKKKEPTKEELVAKYSSNKTFLEDVGLRPEVAFRTDSRPNGQFLKFESLPFVDTAHYKAKWKREILSQNSQILSRQKRRNGVNVVRFFDKDFQKSFLSPDLHGELIDLSHAESRPEIRLRDLRSNLLKFDFKIDDSKVGENLGQSTNPEDEIDDFKMHQVQLKTKEFNEKLRRNPYNEKLWIEFIDFQEQALRDCSFEGEDEKKGEKTKIKIKSGNPLFRQKAVAERKLSILRTALQDNPNSVLLLMKRLKISAEILDPSTLAREWKELLFRFPSNVTLWKSYVTFLSSQFSTFSVSKMIDALSSCVDKFRKISGSNEDHILFVIQLAANVWRSAGHRERGVGLYQALMELNFHSPDQIPENYSLENRIAIFEQFWDCVAPRFGDRGSVGWKNFLQNKSDFTGSAESSEEDPVSDGVEDRLIAEAGGRVAEARLWLAIEQHREVRDWQPYRSKEEESDDPDRTVSLDDLKPFLQVFQDPEKKFKLALAFLKFMGCDFSSKMSRNVDFDFCNLETETMQLWLGFLSPDSAPLEGSILQRSSPDPDRDPSVQSFVRNIFVQAMSVMEDPFRTQLCVLWLKFEQRVIDQETDLSVQKRKLKEMKNSIKKLLEIDRNNIVIYCAFAQALHRLESYKSARKILQTVLSVDKSSFLFRFAVGLELEAHLTSTSSDVAETDDVTGGPHLDEALRLLSLMSTGQSFGAKNVDKLETLSMAHRAKTILEKKLFQENQEFKYDGPSIRKQSPVIFQSQLFDDIFCFVWLTTLTESETEKVDQILEKVCDDLKDQKTFESKVFREHLSVKLRLDVLNFRWTKRSPTQARSILKPLLPLFPSNPILLEFLSNKSDLRPTVSNPFWRESLKVLSGKSVSSSLGLIMMTKILISKFMEVNQTTEEDDGSTNPIAVGYLNKALSILDEATRQEEIKQVVILWRLLMWVTKTLYDIGPKKFKRDSVKSVFYRAIQECPYAKVLYLDLMNYVNVSEDENAVEAELEEIMNEKEIRVRLPMDELKVLLEHEEGLSD